MRLEKLLTVTCNYEDAVYYADGSVALLAGDPETGYHVRHRSTVSELIAAEPNGWTWLTIMHECETGGYSALAGEISWGGAGFIALKRMDNNEFLWVIHLSNCNNFKSFAIQSDAVVAVSDYHYPKGTRFIVPVSFPERLEVMALSAT